MIVTSAALSMAVACGFGFSPGDYGGATTDGGIILQESGRLVDGVAQDGPITTLPDGAPLPAKHLLIVAGERDGPNEVTTGDVWTAPIDAAGKIGDFTPQEPAFFRGTISASNLVNGLLFIETPGVTGRAVEWVSFDGGITSTWQGANVNQPPTSSFAQAFAGTSLLALGGVHYDPVDGGGSLQVRDSTVYVSQFTPVDGGNTYSALSQSSTKLTTGMYGATAVSTNSFVYLFGGNSTFFDTSKVYVARIDPNPGVGVGAFSETTHLTNPTNGQPYPFPSSPIVCAVEGRMFVAGGVGNDVVISAAINENDGTLGDWKGGPKLPGALRAAGCGVWNNTLHFIGGFGATSRTDRIVKAPINADGTLGEWEISSDEKLPSPRSSIVAFTY